MSSLEREYLNSHSGYRLYDSGGFASHVNLSRVAVFDQWVSREKRGLDDPEVRKRIRQEVEKQVKEGRCDWATKEPIF